MIYSDSGETIANMWEKTLESVDTVKLLTSIYNLAMDRLKDLDNVFSVRHYFCLD